MRIRYGLLILSITMISVLQGCYWVIPGSIKRQTNLVNLDVKTCLKEIKAIDDDPNKSEQEKLVESKKKAMRTLNRLKDQVENIDNYTHGRPASPIQE